MVLNRKKIALSSFAFRYSIGAHNYIPQNPMHVLEFMRRANALGFGRVLFYDNIKPFSFDDDTCRAIRSLSDELDLPINLGQNGLEDALIDRHLHLAGLMGAESLRILVKSMPKTADNAIPKICETLRRHLPKFEKLNLPMIIENHFELPTEDLCEIVETLNHPLVRYICDTTNGIAFVEKPLDALNKILAGKAPVYSIHIKDFVFEKPDAGYFMNGAVLGTGAQNLHGLLSTVLPAYPDVIVALELTLKKPENLTDDSAITAWEENNIRRSKQALDNALSKV